MPKNKKLSEKFNAAIWTGQYEIKKWPDQAQTGIWVAETQEELNDKIKILEHKAQKKLFAKFPALPKGKMAVIFGEYAGKKAKMTIESIGLVGNDRTVKFTYKKSGPNAQEGDIYQRYVLAIVNQKPGVYVQKN